MSEFEDRLKDVGAWRVYLIDVLDTADMVRLWLKAKDIPFTAGDVAAFTKMVLDRETSEKGDNRE